MSGHNGSSLSSDEEDDEPLIRRKIMSSKPPTVPSQTILGAPQNSTMPKPTSLAGQKANVCGMQMPSIDAVLDRTSSKSLAGAIDYTISRLNATDAEVRQFKQANEELCQTSIRLEATDAEVKVLKQVNEKLRLITSRLDATDAEVKVLKQTNEQLCRTIGSQDGEIQVLRAELIKLESASTQQGNQIDEMMAFQGTQQDRLDELASNQTQDKDRFVALDESRSEKTVELGNRLKVVEHRQSKHGRSIAELKECGDAAQAEQEDKWNEQEKCVAELRSSLQDHRSFGEKWTLELKTGLDGERDARQSIVDELRKFKEEQFQWAVKIDDNFEKLTSACKKLHRKSFKEKDENELGDNDEKINAAPLYSSVLPATTREAVASPALEALRAKAQLNSMAKRGESPVTTSSIKSFESVERRHSPSNVSKDHSGSLNRVRLAERGLATGSSMSPHPPSLSSRPTSRDSQAFPGPELHTNTSTRTKRPASALVPPASKRPLTSLEGAGFGASTAGSVANSTTSSIHKDAADGHDAVSNKQQEASPRRGTVQKKGTAQPVKKPSTVRRGSGRK